MIITPLLAGGLFLFYLYSSDVSFMLDQAGNRATVLDWTDLRIQDPKTGRGLDSLSRWNGYPVRIAGFMVPLEDDLEKTTEFLLVPYPQACIHTPAPPPDQIVHVKMKDNKALPVDGWNPFWFQGTFHVQKTESQFAVASYFMEGESMETYKEIYENEYVMPLEDPCETDWRGHWFECSTIKLMDLWNSIGL